MGRILETKATGEMPHPEHAPQSYGNRDDLHPVGVHSVRIPTSDSTSIASAASLLDSVGAATQAEQCLDAAKQNTPITHTANPVRQPITAEAPGQMFEVDVPRFPQRLEASTETRSSALMPQGQSWWLFLFKKSGMTLNNIKAINP